MHRQTRLFLMAVGIAAFLSIAIAACIMTATPTENTSDRKQIENASQVYSDAVSAVTPNPIIYRISANKETVIGNEVFSETVRQTVTYGSTDAQPFRGIVNETYTVGDHEISLTEHFDNGNLYITLGDGLFYSPMSEQDYTRRYTPAILITPELYNSISGIATEDGYSLTFTAANGLETWINEPDAVFVSATGTAEIASDNRLTRSFYDASYTRNDLLIRITVTTEILPQPDAVPEVEDKGSFVYLSQPDAPKLLERACGQLLAAGSIEAHYTDTILCEAFGDLQTQQIDVYALNANSWSSRVNTKVKLSSTGKTGSETVITKHEVFQDGSYTIRINDGSPTKDTSVDEGTVRTLCQDILVGTVILPEQITALDPAQDEDSITFTFRASESFAQMIRSAACNKLYGDAEILNTQAQSYVTDTATCYLTLELSTGLPLASGFHYMGTYTIDALPYLLEYSADQQYRIIGDNAGSMISQEP